MRAIYLAFAGLVAGGSTLLGQAALQQHAVPADKKLDEVLANWEKVMTTLATLQAECRRVELDKTIGGTATYQGWAKYLKSTVPGQPSRASLYMEKKDRPDIFEKLVFTGTFLYEYVPQQKVIRVHELPKTKDGQLANDNILGFVFGMTARAAKQRYHLTYQPPPEKDKWYYYIGIQPKEAADKADFSEARLVLWNTTFLPRQFWYVQPNGNEIRWEFPKITPGVAIAPIEFGAPTPPPGWRFERMIRDPQPRVARPNQ